MPAEKILPDEGNAYGAIWGQQHVVSYFDHHRVKSSDVYPSEWIFLRERLKEGMSVLDIGCAQGGFAGIVGEYLKNFSYVGTDISATMLERARQKFPQHRFVLTTSAGDGLYPKEKFDLVMCLGILHLNEDWRSTIQSAWRHTQEFLVLDLRLTDSVSIEDKKKSYFVMTEGALPSPSAASRLPYNVINAAQALAELRELCPGTKKILTYGYTHPVSEFAVCPYSEVLMATFCISRA